MKRGAWLGVATLIAVPVTPILGRAQDTTDVALRDSVARAVRTCDSALVASVVDSERVIVRVTLRRTDGRALSKAYSGLIMQEFANRFRPPQPLRVPVFSAGPIEMQSMRAVRADWASVREPVLNGLYEFVMHRNGTASQLQMMVPSSAGGLDSVVMAVIDTIGREHFFPFPFDEVEESDIRVQLRLTNVYMGNDVAYDLFSSYFPKLPIVDASRIGPEPMPEFPKDERREGLYGDVRFLVVVDRNGRADLTTIELLHAPTEGFAMSAVKTLSEMRWNPAKVGWGGGTCTVPQLVHVNVRFERQEKRERQ